jgi:hypothetical protein
VLDRFPLARRTGHLAAPVISPPQHPTDHPRRASGALSGGGFRNLDDLEARRASQSVIDPEVLALVLDTLVDQAALDAAARWTAQRTHDR